ncbi:uncharacterized protein LOC134177485 [Corticium candelabrum]|uniref:uncharacterized protein LOC134177485 n=1 Tax=Corticium candelabrum TaxID=121492 RepID=UPI002E258513|nr:uncharacterized protein LOC134177485 [Corticium candelabrum]
MAASNGNICLPINCCHTVTATSSNCFGTDEISITGKDHGKCIRTHAVRSFSTAERRGENCSLLPTVISATLGNDITNSTRRETTTEYVKFFSTVKRDSNLPTTMAQTFPIATSPNKDTDFMLWIVLASAMVSLLALVTVVMVIVTAKKKIKALRNSRRPPHIYDEIHTHEVNRNREEPAKNAYQVNPYMTTPGHVIMDRLNNEENPYLHPLQSTREDDNNREENNTANGKTHKVVAIDPERSQSPESNRLSTYV